MPKRKRSVNETIHHKLEKYRIDIFRVISSAKATERKRFGLRLREPGINAQKKARLEQEYHVLKTLDLRQVARHHLHSNLLRIKAVEASGDLPAELREGVPKSTLSPEEITIHNNVVSVLCNTITAKQALDRAVADICETLGVPIAEKSKNVRRRNRQDTQDHVSDRIASPESDGEIEATKAPSKTEDSEGESDEGSEFQGFSEDEDDSRPTGDSHEPRDGADEEGAISKYDTLLGGSSDEEEEFDEELLAKYRGKEQVNLDDISLSGSASEINDFDDLPDSESESEPESESRSPPPKKTKHKTSNSGEPVKKASKTEKGEEKDSKKLVKAKSATKAAVKATKSGNSAFLPTLMGGYISGSESASDIDAPPKKNRKGQRARQAKWEKKYGTDAKHLQKAAAKGGRDAGWDMKRGAVDPGDGTTKGRWGKGGRGLPIRDNRNTHERDARENTRPNPKPTKKDNEGPLHPSWEARKKAKDAEKSATFAGSKIVFD